MPHESQVPLKILVAEDEPAMLGLVARQVRALGPTVVEASEGDTAWELAQEHHPDLVLLDVMMPGMSGWEVCKRLKAGLPGTGVIMLTGIGENLNDMTSPLFAADAWLNKPFDLNELDFTIRLVLEKYGKTLPPVGAKPAATPAATKPAATPAATKPAAKKPAAKPAAKKAAVKKAAAKKPAAKKATAKKPAAKKPAAAKKAAAKKTVAKKAAKKTAARKSK
jgi:DNA-binding response OmpR family regulator